MTEPTLPEIGITLLHGFVALVWAVLAHHQWGVVRTRLPAVGTFRIFPVLAGLGAFYFALMTLGRLLGPHPGAATARVLAALLTLTMVAVAPMLRHLTTGIPLAFGAAQPARAWLARNYGSAVLAGGAVVVFVAAPGMAAERAFLLAGTAATAYLLAMTALAAVEMRGRVRRGPLRLATLLGQLQTSDALVLGAILVLLVVLLVRGLLFGARLGPGSNLAIAAIGLLGAAAFTLRALDFVPRQVATALVALGAAVALYGGGHALATTMATPSARRLVHVVVVVALVVVLGPGLEAMRAAVDRVVLRPGRRSREELQAFLHSLSPELGVGECCRRALAEVARVMHLSAAAVLFTDDEAPVVHGSFRLEPLARVWPRGAAADRLPRRAFGWAWLPELRLREAVAEADVVAIVPIRSPRCAWGHLFLSTGLLGQAKGEEQLVVLEGFADEFARVLDGAELLARALAVERSLAHAEKLAAVGELAARVAHEIRNPVTAARSLAQQLAREPGSPFTAEHALILAELERVERQIAALLRFARREEFHFAPVDLGALVASAVAAFRPRLEAHEVALEVAVADGVVARGDAEKLRQVVVNLLDNALDALGTTSQGPRRVRLRVARADGAARLEVSDNGPGVAAEALPHLFEPFFSRKPHGTGLGLAIARRTAEAHGGRITVESVPGEGTTFTITLPADEGTA
jgi:signal transduction histidine kinase